MRYNYLIAATTLHSVYAESNMETPPTLAYPRFEMGLSLQQQFCDDTAIVIMEVIIVNGRSPASTLQLAGSFALR